MKYQIKFHPEVAYDPQIIAEIVADYSRLAVARKKLAEIERSEFTLIDTPKKGSIGSELGSAVKAIPAGCQGVAHLKLMRVQQLFLFLRSLMEVPIGIRKLKIARRTRPGMHEGVILGRLAGPPQAAEPQPCIHRNTYISYL